MWWKAKTDRISNPTPWESIFQQGMSTIPESKASWWMDLHLKNLICYWHVRLYYNRLHLWLHLCTLQNKGFPCMIELHPLLSSGGALRFGLIINPVRWSSCNGEGVGEKIRNIRTNTHRHTHISVICVNRVLWCLADVKNKLGLSRVSWCRGERASCCSQNKI